MENKQLEIFTKIQTGDYLVLIKEACRHSGGYSEPYPIGFKKLDNAMIANGQKQGGVRNGDFVVITGISKQGKTTFAQNIALNLDKIAIPIVFFSFEVIIDNLYAKFKQMGISDTALIYTAKKNITGNLSWIKEKIKEGKDKFWIKAVFIDHVDFLSPSVKSDDQRRNVITNICQELKNIAVEEEIVIFLLAHVKKVQGREVEMQDLAESGGLYKIPDFIFSVSRTTEVINQYDNRIKKAINEGKIRILGNRLNGQEEIMEFTMENNIIKPKL